VRGPDYESEKGCNVKLPGVLASTLFAPTPVVATLTRPPLLSWQSNTTSWHEHCLSTSQLGIVGSSFLVGFMVASPFFASMVKFVSSAKILSLALACWVLAVWMTGAASNYMVLLGARALSGVAEAAFGCIAPPFLNAAAPPDQRGLWMAIYFCAIPLGSAIGFGLGGSASAAGYWRYPFYLEGLVMCPLVICCFFFPMGRMREKKMARHLARLRRHESGDDAGFLGHLGAQVGSCLGNMRFLCLNLGYAAYTFATGGIIYWGIDFVTHTQLYTDKSTGSLILGGITAVAGLLGTFTGGKILDMYHYENDNYNEQALVTACKLLLCFVASGTPLFVFATSSDNEYVFFIFLFFGEYLLLCVTSVVNTAMLWSLPQDMQTMGMALCIIVIHCFGDVPATPIMGAIQEAVAYNSTSGKASTDQDTVTRSWHAMFYVAEAMLIVAFFFWFLAMRASEKWIIEGTPAIRASLLHGTGGNEDMSPMLTGVGDPEASTYVAPPMGGARDSWDEEDEEDLLEATAVIGGDRAVAKRASSHDGRKSRSSSASGGRAASINTK